MVSLTDALLVDVQVLYVLTRLRAGTEKAIFVNLRRNDCGLRTRQRLRDSLGRLVAAGVVVHDAETHEYAVIYERMDPWLAGADASFRSAEKEVSRARDLLFRTGEQVKGRGAWWYAFAKVEKVEIQVRKA